MKQASFSKVVLALVLILINTCSGCTTRDTGTGPVTGRPTDEPSGLRLLTTDNHKAFLARILVDHRVESFRRMFELKGLGTLPVAGFTVEGRNADGVLATVTVMVFLRPDSTAAGTLAFIQGGERSRVCAAVLRTAAGSTLSSTADVTLTDYAVRDDGRVTALETVLCDTTGAQEGIGFWNCVGANSVAGAIVCTLKCLPAGPLYADCLIACTGWAILAAIITCAFAELLTNGD